MPIRTSVVDDGAPRRKTCESCRGARGWCGAQAGATADHIFDLVDADRSGTIESAELLLHLLVAGQEVDAISELFRVLDTDQDGVISREEWRSGFARYLGLAHAAGCESESSADSELLAPAAAPTVSGTDESASAPPVGEVVGAEGRALAGALAEAPTAAAGSTLATPRAVLVDLDGGGT